MTKPRILFFDIESAGINALKSDLGFVILFGYKWSDKSKARVIQLDARSLRSFDDRKLLVEASLMFRQADLTVAHYGSVFDRRFIQGRLLIHNLPPIPPTKMRDTCMIARSVANFSSNRLKHLARTLSLRHQKLENDWPTAWFEVMRGDTRALAKMAAYCKGDVLALEELYYRLRAFDQPHPAMYADREKCGTCGGEVRYSGKLYVGRHAYRQYQCKVCHKWGRDTRRIADAK